jgi:hypothetical protein
MDKRQLINHLRAAKAAHIKWRSYAQALVAGLPLGEGQVPVIHTDCAFGKWYYGPGQRLSSLPAFGAIETPHESLHAIYMDIFKLLFETEDAGFFRKLIGASKRQNQKNDRIESLLSSLLEMSKTLLDAIELLERDMLAMDDREIAALV